MCSMILMQVSIALMLYKHLSVLVVQQSTCVELALYFFKTGLLIRSKVHCAPGGNTEPWRLWVINANSMEVIIPSVVKVNVIDHNTPCVLQGPKFILLVV